MGGETGTPQSPTPATSGGTGNFSLSGMAGGDKNYGLTGFGTTNPQPYQTGQGLSGAFTQQNDKAMGLDNLSSSFADQKGSKEKLKLDLIGMAKQSANDLVSFRNYGFSPQIGASEEQPVWQKGYSTRDIYNSKVKGAQQRFEDEIIKRYSKGQVI